MPVPEHVFAAARTGDIAVLREYFASGDRDPNDTVERTGWTLLDGACFGKTEGTRGRRIISCEVVSFLLSQGAAVEYQDPGGTWHRPLVIAAASCSTNDEQYRSEDWICAALKLLIDAGANVVLRATLNESHELLRSAPTPSTTRRRTNYWSGNRSTTYFRAWMYMIGTPGIFRSRFFKSLSHVATIKHLWTLQCSTMSSSA